MLKTVFPEEDADDPFASIIAKQPKIIDHNLKLEKGMKPKQKWKIARYLYDLCTMTHNLLYFIDLQLFIRSYEIKLGVLRELIMRKKRAGAIKLFKKENPIQLARRYGRRWRGRVRDKLHPERSAARAAVKSKMKSKIRAVKFLGKDQLKALADAPMENPKTKEDQKAGSDGKKKKRRKTGTGEENAGNGGGGRSKRSKDGDGNDKKGKKITET